MNILNEYCINTIHVTMTTRGEIRRTSLQSLCSNHLHPVMAVQSKQLTPMGYALAGALGGCFSNAYVDRKSNV